jgi:glutamate racemase
MGEIPMFDGGEGTAHELHRQLERHGLLGRAERKGQVVLLSSLDTEESRELYRQMYGMEI